MNKTDRIDRTGEIKTNNFGSKVIIIKYRNANNMDILFPKYNYITKHIKYDAFKKGNVRCPYEPRFYGHGYLGEGNYRIRENEKQTRAYKIWYSMLQRCYDPKYHEKEPTYVGCSVCDEWLNFQNFAQWYEENYYNIPGQRMNLDKDILVKGNKVYSPETCVFVPQNLNKLFIKRDSMRGNCPVGVTYIKQHKKYQAACSIGTGKPKYLGYYNTPESAFNAYKEFKEAYIRKVANEYLEDIPFELYRAMVNYEVNIDD